MSSLVESKLPCPKEDCGSSDAYCHYRQPDGTINGYCWSCNRPHYYEEQPVKQLPSTQQAVYTAPQLQWQVMEDQDRCISQAVNAMYGIETGLGPDFRPVAKRYPYYSGGTLTGHKIRTLPKQFRIEGNITDAEPFGWAQACAEGGRWLYIVEGEEDVPAGRQALLTYQAGGKYADNGVSVITSPTGAESLMSLPERVNAETSRWQRVVLAIDKDKAGDAVLDRLAGAFNLPVDIVTLDVGLKDASGYMKAGRGGELAKLLLFGGKPWSPASLSVFTEPQVTQLPVPVKAFAVPGVSANFGMIREGMVIGVCGAPGSGKTVFMAQEIGGWLTSGYLVGSFFLEDSEAELASRVAGSILGVNLLSGGTHPQADEAVSWVYRHTARVANGLSLRADDLLSHMRFLRYTRNVQVFFIDPVNYICDGSASKINEEMAATMNKIVEFAQVTRSIVYYSSHLNPAKYGQPHDKGGDVTLDQLTGSRAAARYSHLILGVQRNQQAETEEERNTVCINCIKNRYQGKLGKMYLIYTHAAGRMSFIPEQIQVN